MEGMILQGVYLEMIEIYSDQKLDLLPSNEKITAESSQIHKIGKNQIIDIKSSLNNNTLFAELNRCVVNREISSLFLILNDAYIFTIALLRALRICLQKQKKAFTIGTISSPSGNEKEYDLIRFTHQVQAAQAGGSNCHLFQITPMTPDDHLTRMIHINNILNMESNHDLPKDPWKGAYAIEHLTKYIFEKIEKGGPRD